MWANRILEFLLSLITFLIVPIQFITTFVLGIVVTLTFDLLLIPIELLWKILFLGPLLGLSWVWQRTTFWELAILLNIPIAILGIPIAFVAHIYVCLMPSMGELGSRMSKLLFSETWPFSLDCRHMLQIKDLPVSPTSHDFRQVLTRCARKNEAYSDYLEVIGVPFGGGGWMPF